MLNNCKDKGRKGRHFGHEIVRVPTNASHHPFDKGGSEGALKKSGQAIMCFKMNGSPSALKKTVLWN